MPREENRNNGTLKNWMVPFGPSISLGQAKLRINLSHHPKDVYEDCRYVVYRRSLVSLIEKLPEAIAAGRSVKIQRGDTSVEVTGKDA